MLRMPEPLRARDFDEPVYSPAKASGTGAATRAAGRQSRHAARLGEPARVAQWTTTRRGGR